MLGVKKINDYLNKKYPTITQEYLKEIFTYDYSNGELYWKLKTGSSCNLTKPVGYFNKYLGYKMLTIRYKPYKLHRIIWFYHHGYLPEHDIDHIDQNKINNRIENLRKASGTCNAVNTGNTVRNTSGVKGVRLHRGSRWIAFICNKGKLRYLGSFSQFIDAVKARYNEEIKLGWSEFNKNTPAAEYINKYQKEI